MFLQGSPVRPVGRSRVGGGMGRWGSPEEGLRVGLWAEAP